MMLNSKMSHELIGNDAISNYINGGKGVVTLVSDVSANHHTYQFRIPEFRKDDEDTMFIFTLVDNNEWVYVGMYKDKGFRFTAKSRYNKDSSIVRGVAYIIKLMNNPGYSDDRMHLLHEGVCCRCGRPLTNPTSIELGIGPTCAELG